MDKSFKSLSLVYGLLQEAHDLGMRAYAAEKMGETKRFRKLLEEAYIKIKTCLPLLPGCSNEIKATVYLMCAWYSKDLGENKVCLDYIVKGKLLKEPKYNPKFDKVLSQIVDKV